MKKIFSVLLLVSFTFMLSGCGLISGLFGNDELEMNLFSDGLLAVENEDGEWGYINKKGEVEIDFEYDGAGAFMDGNAIAMYDDEDTGAEYFIINQKGERISDKFDGLILFENIKLYRFKEDDKWGLLDFDGEELLKAEYSSIQEFYEGYAIAYVDKENDDYSVDRTYLVLNEKGEEFFKDDYDRILSWSGEVFTVRNELDDYDYTYFLVDEDGNKVGKEYDYISGFNEEGFAVATISADDEDSDDVDYLINEKGEEIFDAYSIDLGDNIYAVKLDADEDKMMLYDEKGEAWIDDEFDYISYIQENPENGYVYVYYSDNYGEDDQVAMVAWYDGKGNLIQEEKREDIEIVYTGMYHGDRYIYIPDVDEETFETKSVELFIDEDTSIEFMYDEISQMVDDKTFIVVSDGKYGIVDNEGEVLVDFIYDILVYLDDDYYAYGIENDEGQKIGILESNFDVLITAKYQDINIDYNIY
jgi:hypothetical protein